MQKLALPHLSASEVCRPTTLELNTAQIVATDCSGQDVAAEDRGSRQSWYRRAGEPGETEAEILLTAAHRHRQDELTEAQHKIAPRERRAAIEQLDDVVAKKPASADASQYVTNPRSTIQAQPDRR